MLDLSAAFDTVNHKYILEDLSVGMDDYVLKWYESYLQEKEVIVRILNKTEKKLKECRKLVSQDQCYLLFLQENLPGY